MKLLRKTMGLYLVMAIPIFFASMGGFFYFLRFVITKQVDASLLQDKYDITEFVNNNKNDVTELYKSISCSYYLREIPPDSIIPQRSRFISVYDSVAQGYEPIRELRSTLKIKDKNYEIILHASFVDSGSLIYSIGTFALFLFIILTLGISVVQVFISKQIWDPFKKTLRKISRFKPGAKQITEFNETPIYEFSVLNAALGKMVERINTDFELQKRFIDNISHELQTPVSVLSTQVELLIQEMELKESSANIIGVIEDTLLKMRKINQALLFLSKIENDQYSDIQNISIPGIVARYLETYRDQINFKQINVVLNMKDNLHVNMDPALAEVLIGNLITNAIVHNMESGRINIEVAGNIFEINNTGERLDVEPEELFNKFVHFGNSENSSGIGLSLVKEICNYYGLGVSYQITGNIHALKVYFNTLDSL